MNFSQVFQLPGDHIAFVFSDQAGANACTALGKMIGDYKNVSLYSNRDYNGGVKQVIFTKEQPSLDGVETIFLGTSHPASSDYFELNCLKEAKHKNIHTISFVDHWVNFKLRFTDTEGKTIYPDEIWVVDEKAKQLAVAEGLPRELIKVSGNPYHYYLKNYWKSKFTGKAYLEKLGIPTGGFHILFAPDPLSLRHTKEELGFDEEEALRDILDVFSDLNDENIHLVVKCHPLQPEGIFEKEIEATTGGHTAIIKKADTLELINASDLVIGFYSNLLLDANALGKNVTRYFPGNDELDFLCHDSSLLKIKNKKDLYHHLKNIVYG